MERNKEAQTNQLQDLQNELKSLKSLLLNRTGQRPYTPTTSTSFSSSTSAPSLNLQSTSAPNGTDNSPLPQTLNATHLSGTETPPNPNINAMQGSTTGGGGALSYISGRPGIPAWQLAAREKAHQASKVEEEAPVA